MTGQHPWGQRLDDRPFPKVYPSFYAAVHRARNHVLEDIPDLQCRGAEAPYEPDEHRCFEMAASIRVELHAAGISLSSDLGGSGLRHLLEPIGTFETATGLAPGTLRLLDDIERAYRRQQREDAHFSEPEWRNHLAASEAAAYRADDEEPVAVRPEATWQRWIGRILGRKVF